MNLNILLRGQSNALWLAEGNGWAGATRLVQEVQRLLGFDGVTDRVTLEYAAGSADGNTVNSGTAFLGEWIQPVAGDWTRGWQIAQGSYEQGLLDFVGGLPAAQRAEPTAVLWLHSEYDSRRNDLSPAEWTSGVRFDAAALRAAFGKTAAELPYLFVSAHPYWGTDSGHQAIRIGMEELAADPSFNADIAARALDLDISRDNYDGNAATIEYGGSHISDSDALLIADRTARSLAETWAQHARPGSPVALAGRNIDDHGPQVIQAVQVATDSLQLRVAFDAATTLRALDADAANGVGWSVQTPAGMLWATGAELIGSDTLKVTFGGPIYGSSKLYYGWGYGRLGGADGAGQGNAVYDNQGMPIWVDAHGLQVGNTMAAPSPVNVTLRVGTGSGADSLVLRLSQDFWQGAAQYTISVDDRQVGGVLTASALRSAGQSDTVTLLGDWASGNHKVTVRFLNDAWGGTDDTDRNLFLVGITYNGVAQPGGPVSVDQWTPANFTFTDTGGTTPPPANRLPEGAPSITGTATQGQVLTATRGSLVDADGMSAAALAYTWLRDGATVLGTGSTYRLVEGDVGHGISVEARYTDDRGTAERVASVQAGPVLNLNDIPTGAPTVSGTPVQGQVLTASAGTLADADGLGTLSFVWQRDLAAIPGATAATYTLAAADLGRTITVAARYTDGHGTPEQVVSAPTAQVTAAPPPPTGPTNGDDVLSGTAGPETINALAGNDSVFGGGGNDTLIGGDRRDTLDGGTGSDSLSGGSGDDTYVVDSNGDRVSETSAGGGLDTVLSGLGFTLPGNVERLTLTGGAASSGTGNWLPNLIRGNGAANTLRGEGGADTLFGGAGADRLTGGASADRFAYEAFAESGTTSATRDVITDFDAGGRSSAVDRIDLSAIDPSATAGDQAFAFRGTAGFQAGQAQVRYGTANRTTTIEVSDGIGSGPDMTIQLSGTLSLDAGDFVL